MIGGYPDHQTYRELYLRYFSGRDVGELLDLLMPLAGARFLDLCCGEGQMTLVAIARGVQSAVCVDAEPAMIAPVLQNGGQIRVVTDSVQNALRDFNSSGLQFDRIACRQAINYWLNQETAGLVAAVLPRGGVFAFNTFNQKPPEKPRVLEYELEEHLFVEVSWLVGDTVHHLQVRDGLLPHYTSFQWLASQQLHKLLEPHFAVREQKQGKTSLYQCEKK